MNANSLLMITKWFEETTSINNGENDPEYYENFEIPIINGKLRNCWNAEKANVSYSNSLSGKKDPYWFDVTFTVDENDCHLTVNNLTVLVNNYSEFINFINAQLEEEK
jgi:hypothetical protein